MSRDKSCGNPVFEIPHKLNGILLPLLSAIFIRIPAKIWKPRNSPHNRPSGYSALPLSAYTALPPSFGARRPRTQIPSSRSVQIPFFTFSFTRREWSLRIAFRIAFRFTLTIIKWESREIILFGRALTRTTVKLLFALVLLPVWEGGKRMKFVCELCEEPQRWLFD